MDQNVTKAGLIVIAVVGLVALFSMSNAAMQWLNDQFAALFALGF